MAVIRLIDPNNTNVKGGLYGVDPTPWASIKSGAPLNLLISDVWSEGGDPFDDLFQLDPPFSKEDIYMVWGNFNGSTGILTLYLAKSTGDTTYPFADVHDFGAALDSAINGNVSGSGDAYLNRPKRLPTNVNWDFFQ